MYILKGHIFNYLDFFITFEECLVVIQNSVLSCGDKKIRFFKLEPLFCNNFFENIDPSSSKLYSDNYQ